MFLKVYKMLIIAITFYQGDSNYCISDSVNVYKNQWKWVHILDWFCLFDLNNIVSVFIIMGFESCFLVMGPALDSNSKF